MSARFGSDGERLVPLGGVRQWVRVEGAGHATVPLVVLHGGPGGNQYVFERTAGPLLARERTVVYHEQRGCGRSEAPGDPTEYAVPTLVRDLEDLRTWLGVDRVDLLGYSFGGGLALAYAHAHPTRVRRVVAQAPVLDLHDPRIVTGQLQGFRTVATGPVATRVRHVVATDAPEHEQLDRVWASVDRATVDVFLFHDPRHAERNRAWWVESGLVNTGRMHAVVRSCPILPWSALREVFAPVLVVMGRHDRNVPVAYAEDVARTLPHASLHVVEAAAHFPDVESPEAYAAAVLAFLE